MLVAATLLPTTVLLSGVANATTVSPSGAQGTATIQCRVEGDGYFVDSSGVGFNKARLYTVPAGEDASAGSWSDWDDVPYFTRGYYQSPQGGDAVYVEYAYWNDHAWETVGEWARVVDGAGVVQGSRC